MFCCITDDSPPGTIVKLKISASGIIELFNNILICFSNILNQFFIRCIKLSCCLKVCRHNHLLKCLRWSWNRIFRNSIFIFKLFQKLKVFYKWMCLSLNLSYKISIIKHCQFAIKTYSVTSCLMSNSFEAPHKIKMPEGSSELSICDYMKA